MKYTRFLDELSNTERLVHGYLDNEINTGLVLRPAIIRQGVTSYLQGGGKRLRPAVLMLACLAVGGNRQQALPAGVAVELFHTWTLVHDDIIDNDKLRRGMETVHITCERYAMAELGLGYDAAAKYGTDMAMLSGDVQHGWAISLLSHNLVQSGVKPEIALHLITLLQVNVLRTLVEGEVMDVDFGFARGIETLEEAEIVDMLWKKTGVLYEFCGIAGALIGKNELVYDDEVESLKAFCSLCGTAFQIRDDILGLTGTEAILGKPVGADIREGKKTILVKEALTNSSEEQREIILRTLGNKRASASDIQMTTRLITELGGIERAHQIASGFVQRALPHLDKLPDSANVALLHEWANYLIERVS